MIIGPPHTCNYCSQKKKKKNSTVARKTLGVEIFYVGMQFLAQPGSLTLIW